MRVQHTLQLDGSLLIFDESKVMGIINVTPDSFYKGSRAQYTAEILNRVESMLDAGVTFIDIGGYSTRPGAMEVSVEEEKRRVCHNVEAVKKDFPDAIVSIDTFRSAVAESAVNHGASLINDVSGGLADSNMFAVVARLQVPYVLMHMRGTPQTMTALSSYDHLLKEVFFELSQSIQKANDAGIKDVIIDPGFGFAKTREQNFELLENLNQLESFNRPVLVGVSRKSMIYKSLNISSEESLNGTTVLNTVALLKGADILRVHDVKEAVEAIKLTKSLSH